MSFTLLAIVSSVSKLKGKEGEKDKEKEKEEGVDVEVQIDPLFRAHADRRVAEEKGGERERKGGRERADRKKSFSPPESTRTFSPSQLREEREKKGKEKKRGGGLTCWNFP